MIETKKIQLIADDGWLAPYEYEIEDRQNRFFRAEDHINNSFKSLLAYAAAHQYLGLHYDAEAQGWHYREWAPNVEEMHLIGDFNQWNRTSHPMIKDESDVWSIFISNESDCVIQHLQNIKVQVTCNGNQLDRIPAYINYALQDEETKDFSGTIWSPEKKYQWKNGFKGLKSAPIIYECHVGMSQEKEGLGTYREFADNTLPRIKKLGYNCLQMMAIKEHPYYGSFGYHVSNYFAASSRFGTPEDLKYLVDKAHEQGIAVIMDLVHSHAVKNEAEGLNNFDGSEGQYFHEGGRGYHNQWDSKLFNYGKQEVQQFLLSNLRYWMEEYRMDGFRFDGVTSMMYHHHGRFIAFDHYDKYFKFGVDWDAVTYLQLANRLIHRLNPNAITIAEDNSGMPGLARTIEDGGIGFDYRLGMGVPDYWIKLLKHTPDENWDMNEIWSELSNRRYKEKTIGYAESHDQALVGDKSIAFWLMDKEMYWHMKVDDNNMIVERGIAMHKMIRCITASLSGEGYLNFIGNEFGHPEWVDFPREGNDWSYKYARRQWSLVDNEGLKYKWLNDFDAKMIDILKTGDVLNSNFANQLNVDNHNKVLAFERANKIFVFNFSPSASIPNYKFRVPKAGDYKIVLNSDAKEFGGHNRVDESITYTTQDENGNAMLSVYCTSRTCLVFELVY